MFCQRQPDFVLGHAGGISGPVLIGFAVWLVLWLWKNLNRFGPVEAETVPPESRGYEHHLEALGDFHWRLDRGASLLAPLRAQIIEAGEKAVARARLDSGNFYQLLADRSGLPVERIRQSLAEVPPGDSTQLTRTARGFPAVAQNPPQHPTHMTPDIQDPDIITTPGPEEQSSRSFAGLIQQIEQLFAMDLAVLVPPVRFFLLSGEPRYDALGLLLHRDLSRKTFLFEPLAENAVTARTKPPAGSGPHS